MNSTALKLLSWAGKIAGIITTIDLTPVNQKWGPVIFFAASLLKDTVNRIADFLDDGKINNSVNPPTT